MGLGQYACKPSILPFLEKDGSLGGPPADDETALRELDECNSAGRLTLSSAGRPSGGWKRYREFRDELHTHHRCVLENERLVVYITSTTNKTTGPCRAAAQHHPHCPSTGPAVEAPVIPMSASGSGKGNLFREYTDIVAAEHNSAHQFTFVNVAVRLFGGDDVGVLPEEMSTFPEPDADIEKMDWGFNCRTSEGQWDGVGPAARMPVVLLVLMSVKRRLNVRSPHTTDERAELVTEFR